MRTRRAWAASMLVASIAGAGCALLIPPSWRGRAPLPLAGEVDTTLAAGGDASLDLADLSNERLLVLVDADRERLVQIAGEDGPRDEGELRAIASRLPRLLRELERRGERPPGARARHPVIR